MKEQNKFFQPVVLDETGSLKQRFNELKKRTRIEKRALSAKIFEIGLARLEKTIQPIFNK